ncbi:epoxide hydrolase [Rhodobacteraceae bacterium CCMM004]|nr:epoxide hydrolase [Rhodobacteraceae bacterium CCMM004]
MPGFHLPPTTRIAVATGHVVLSSMSSLTYQIVSTCQIAVEGSRFAQLPGDRKMKPALVAAAFACAAPIAEAQMTAEPFPISFPEDAVADLVERLEGTRFPEPLEGVGWGYGIAPEFLRDLVANWADMDFDAAAERMNAVPGFVAEIDGQSIHFLHLPSSDPEAIPLMLLHGWPSTFLQMREIAPMLAAPAGDGPAFHVVAPSLIGYGYASRPTAPGMSPSAMAPYMHTLMTEVLGYDRYGLRSSDLGAGVAARMAADYPQAIVGSHTGGTNPWLQGPIPDDLSEAEQAFVANAQQWMQTEMAYAFLHASKPETLAVALTDSPAGLAAWIGEKMHRWVDHDGDLWAEIDKDAVLDTLTVYWMTGTIGSSMRLYAEAARDTSGWAVPQVPVGYLMPRNDFFPTPRSWMERMGPIGHWTETKDGGHFMELEEPALVAEDLRRFFGGLQ